MAGMSPESYWRGPNSQEGRVWVGWGEGGEREGIIPKGPSTVTDIMILHQEKSAV